MTLLENTAKLYYSALLKRHSNTDFVIESLIIMVSLEGNGGGKARKA